MNFAARHSLIKPKDSLTQQQFSVGRYGALKLISDEMLNKYFWQNMTFPRMMEEKGFPENQTDGLQQYHYRDMDLSCGTPCITTLTKLSTAIILVKKKWR